MSLMKMMLILKIIMGINIWNVLKNKEIWNKIKYFIKHKDGGGADYEDNYYMKIKISSIDDLLLFLSDVMILIRSVFEVDGAYYLQAFLEEAFYDEEKSDSFKSSKKTFIDFLKQ